MMKKIMFMVLGLVMLIALSGCSAGGNKASSEGSTASANSAPSFTLKDVNGKTHSLKDYAGQKVYLKFWASWCSICLAGLEDVNTLAQEKNDFVVLTIVSPGYKNEKDVSAFKKWFSGVDEAKNLIVLLDEDGKIADQFGVRGYPTSAYMDANGDLVQTLAGHVSNEEIVQKFTMIP